MTGSVQQPTGDTLDGPSSDASDGSHTLGKPTETQAGREAGTRAPQGKIEKQIETAAMLKEEGNALFARGDRMGAMAKWHHALLNSAGINSLASQYGSKSTEAQIKQGQAITMAVQNNLANCYLADKKYEKVIYATGKVLSLDDHNLKALYRRAKAYKELGEEKKSAKDLDRALDIAPDDSSLRSLATELVKLEEARLAKQKKQLTGFLNGKSFGE